MDGSGAPVLSFHSPAGHHGARIPVSRSDRIGHLLASLASAQAGNPPSLLYRPHDRRDEIVDGAQLAPRCSTRRARAPDE